MTHVYNDVVSAVERSKFLELISLVHEYGNQAANIVSANRNSPLHLCSLFGKDDYVALLLHRGARPNVRDNRGRTPLMLAAANGSARSVQLLLMFNATVEAVDNDGDNALLIAASRSCLDVARILLDEGNANVNSRSALGLTPLMHAVRNGSEDLIRLFLRHHAHDATTYDGDSTVDLAKRHGYVDIAFNLDNHFRGISPT